MVRAIHVRDGQSVKAGEVLIELDPTMTEAEEDHLKSDLVAAELDVARLRAALAGQLDFVAPSGASPAQIEMQRQFLVRQSAEQNAKLTEIDRQRRQKEAERATVTATIGKLNATIPLLQERVDLRKYLTNKELGSKLPTSPTSKTSSPTARASRPKEPLPRSRCCSRRTKRDPDENPSEYRRALFDDLAKAEQRPAALRRMS